MPTKEIILKAIWDEAFLKQHERDVREDALAVQSDEDWQSAELLLERAMSDACDGYVECPLSACRRAYRCVGNRPICLPRCKVEFEPGGEQQLFEDFYAEIQQERRDAAAENRAPMVERVRKDRVHVEDENIEDEPAAKSAEGELERNMQIAREALRRDEALSPPPRPNLAKPEPPAAPVPDPPAANTEPAAPVVPPAPPPSAAWEPKISPETEERINQIWADYVAGKPMPRPEPRIRSLSDDRPWSVPPGWKGPR
ncbi:hypothetical protein [Bradyrhizobium sp.]